MYVAPHLPPCVFLGQDIAYAEPYRDESVPTPMSNSSKASLGSTSNMV